MIIDPQDPTSNAEHSSEGVILKGVKTIFETYAEQFELQQRWKFVSSKHLALSLNFPKQPSGNGHDCGVFVYIYAWAFLTGSSWPKGSIRGSQIKIQFERMRKYIASFILQ